MPQKGGQMTRQEWGTQVKVALIQKNMKQRDLAEALGLGEMFINRVINGTQGTPTAETVKRISAELGLDVPEDVNEAEQ